MICFSLSFAGDNLGWMGFGEMGGMFTAQSLECPLHFGALIFFEFRLHPVHVQVSLGDRRRKGCPPVFLAYWEEETASGH